MCSSDLRDRADVPQARAHQLRRLPDSRARSKRVQRGGERRRLLAEVRAQNVSQFQWRQPPYEYEEVKLPFDILAGSCELRQQVEAGLPVRTIYYSWEREHERFAKTRAPFLLY